MHDVAFPTEFKANYARTASLFYITCASASVASHKDTKITKFHKETKEEDPF